MRSNISSLRDLGAQNVRAKKMFNKNDKEEFNSRDMEFNKIDVEHNSKSICIGLLSHRKHSNEPKELAVQFNLNRIQIYNIMRRET